MATAHEVRSLIEKTTTGNRGRRAKAGADARIEESGANGEMGLAFLPYGRTLFVSPRLPRPPGEFADFELWLEIICAVMSPAHGSRYKRWTDRARQARGTARCSRRLGVFPLCERSSSAGSTCVSEALKITFLPDGRTHR
jgi:hypothetical protein